MDRILTTLRRLALLAAVAATSGVLAAEPRLPADFTFPQGEGSPGKVTFSHGSHVDGKKPTCVGCHPRLFRTLEKGQTADGSPIRHAVMEKGAQCGLCHGKAAFGFDSCDLCHR